SDIVTIFPGIYFESVVVPAGKDGLLISGMNPLTVTLDADVPNTGTAITVGSSNVTVEKLTIRNGRVGLRVDANGVTLQRLRLFGIGTAAGEGHAIELGLGVTGARILGNEVRSIRA